jgi:hypothetical protein
MKIKIACIIVILPLIFLSCKKKGDMPTVTTTTVTSITMTTATGGGNVTADGGEPVTAKGICWAKTASPTLSNITSVDGSGTGEYTSHLSMLSGGTLYYVRAYATNKAGTAYGSEVTFTTY